MSWETDLSSGISGLITEVDSLETRVSTLEGQSSFIADSTSSSISVGSFNVANKQFKLTSIGHNVNANDSLELKLNNGTSLHTFTNVNSEFFLQVLFYWNGSSTLYYNAELAAGTGGSNIANGSVSASSLSDLNFVLQEGTGSVVIAQSTLRLV